MPAEPTQPRNSTHAPKPLPVWRAAFLKALSSNANVSAAARAAEVDRSHCYKCRSDDPSFAEEWDEALVVAVEALEERAWKRAQFTEVQYKFTKSGAPILHPITGEPYYEHVGSDAVLMRLLQAHKPEAYKERTEQQHTGEVVLKAEVTIMPAVGNIPVATSEKEVRDV